MSKKLRLAVPVFAVAAALVAVTSCAKKTENTAQTSPSTSGQPTPPPTDTAANPPAGSPSSAPGTPASPGATPAAPGAPAAPETTPPPPVEPPPPPPPQPATFVVPAGTALSVRTISSLSTKTNKTGEPFTATLAAPLRVQGVTIARTGSTVSGTIADADPGGRVKGVASMTLSVNSITTVDHQKLQVAAAPITVDAKTTKKKDAAKIGGAAAVGTVIGAIAGGGKGAAIGALAGGGAGTGVVLATRGDPAVLPSESVINTQLARPLTVTEQEPNSILRKKPATAAPVDQPPPQ